MYKNVTNTSKIYTNTQYPHKHQKPLYILKTSYGVGSKNLKIPYFSHFYWTLLGDFRTLFGEYDFFLQYPVTGGFSQKTASR